MVRFALGYYKQPRGLISVWGKEAVQFLDGLITNDVKTLADGSQMLAAFPNANGRLLAVARVARQGDRFLIETEEATREKVFLNLLRFTFAGDFFVEDISEGYKFFEVFGEYGPNFGTGLLVRFEGRRDSHLYCVAAEAAEEFVVKMKNLEAPLVDDEHYETRRIEYGVPKYGVDMDETTIVPELGLPLMISYTKGCYVGQEIIARIHFRGHVAKQLTGLVAERAAVGTRVLPGAELTTADGKNAGRITSVTYSPKLEKTIALGYVRYDYLEEGTQLAVTEQPVIVKGLPFVG